MSQKLDAKEFPCPSCGGRMVFDPHTQMIRCRYCDTAYPVNNRAGADSEEAGADSKKMLPCPNCGMEMEFNALNLSVDCPACGSSFIVKETDDSEEAEKSDFIIPFSTTQENYQKSFISWLAEGEFVPNDIFDEARFITQQGVYVPVYRISGSYSVQYTASIGYDRIEQYETTEKVYENGHSYDKRVIKERKVTDWHPFSSTIGGEYTVDVCATDYFSELRRHAPAVDNGGVDEIAAIPTFCEQNGYGPREAYDPRYTAGFVTLPINIEKEKAYADSGKGKVAQIIQQRITESAPGDRINHISWNGEVERRYTCEYRPFWLTKYSYNGTAYCNIADGTRVSAHAGSRPFDAQRRQKISQFFLPLKISAVFVLPVLIMVVMLATESDLEVLPAIVIALLIGGIMILAPYLYGRTRRKSLLVKNVAYRKERAAEVLKNMSTFFDRKSDIKEADAYIGAADKKWKPTAEEVKKRNKDPRFLLKCYRWGSVGFGGFILCMQFLLLSGMDTIYFLAALLPIALSCILLMVIPYIVYINKVKKIDKAYKPKRDYGIAGGILSAFMLLIIIGAVVSIANRTPASNKEPVNSLSTRSTSSTTTESRFTTGTTLYGESTYSNTQTEASASSVEGDGEAAASTSAVAPTDSVDQTNPLTPSKVARMWEKGCRLAGTVTDFSFHDWDTVTTGDTVSIRCTKSDITEYTISCDADKRCFTATCSYLYPTDTDDFCYTAVSAFTGYDTYDTRGEAFFQPLKAHMETNGNTSKSVFSYGGFTVTFEETEIDHLGNKCTVVIREE